MKKINIEHGFAILAAVVVLVGVFFAEDAARSVKKAVQLELDIQLGNHISTVKRRD